MTFTPPIATGIICGILIVIQIALMLSVIVLRQRNKQSLGETDNPDLQRAVRRHGNFAENAAIFAVAFALLEILGGSRTNIEILGAIFILGTD